MALIMTLRLTLPNGTDLAYESTGEGPLAVHAHGLLLSRQAEADLGLFGWAAVEALPGRRFVRYDARGHGESGDRPHADDYTYPRFADDLLALMDHLDGGRPVAGMGGSLGCATVLTAAVRAPERFDRLVLMIPPTAWETRPAQAELYRGLADVTEKEGMEGFAAALAGAPVPESLVGAPGYPPRSPGAHPGTLPALLRGAAASDLPAREEIARLAQPALVLTWSGDPGHPVSTAEQLAELLPDARLHVSHDPTDIATWDERIADFLRG
ncbi:alpha/beta fold hydrolase [Streptomyces cynarae]|uniref:alpha/beta fold hydrolase n=1 Tax=Streptomyces cynarae TaxID=2981134 RepID=UPI00406C4BD4